MTGLAFAILGAAALIGLGLALPYLRGPAARRGHPAISAFHGAIGAAGLVILLAGLGRAPPMAAMGTAGFGRISAALFGLALSLGLVIAAWRGRRPPGALVGAHAGFAVAGLAVLLALIALR